MASTAKEGNKKKIDKMYIEMESINKRLANIHIDYVQVEQEIKKKRLQQGQDVFTSQKSVSFKMRNGSDLHLTQVQYSEMLSQTHRKESSQNVLDFQLNISQTVDYPGEIKTLPKQPPKEAILDEQLVENNNEMELNIKIPNLFQGQIFYNKTQTYRQVCGHLQNGIFSILKFQLAIPNIIKVKALPEAESSRNYKIKIVDSDLAEHYFAVDIKKESLSFPLHYTWFAKLINAKLMERGTNLNKPIIQADPSGSINVDNAFMHGSIYKKSQYKKKWEMRYIVINTEGLFSYKNVNQSYSFFIDSSEIKYLWTRFDVHNRFLIIKLRYGLADKTEFAIPVLDYCQRHPNNWLYPFYRLMMEHEHHIKHTYY